MGLIAKAKKALVRNEVRGGLSKGKAGGWGLVVTGVVSGLAWAAQQFGGIEITPDQQAVIEQAVVLLVTIFTGLMGVGIREKQDRDS